jgi:uncharacterized 2Fe-2S/4Fe-4S cluster protein (DUF4445 family)
VIVRQGEVQTEPTGFLSPEEVAQGYVLACRTQVFGDLLVEVPLESRWEGRALLGQLDSIRFGQILPCHPGARPYRDEPLSQKVFLSLPEPTLADHVSDWERVQRALGKEGKEGEGRGGKGTEEDGGGGRGTEGNDGEVFSVDLPTLQRLPGLLRENNWQVTVTLGERRVSYPLSLPSPSVPFPPLWEILDLEPGDTSGRNYGVAVDIGTTTVVAHLIDLATGRTVSQQGRYNSQIRYGEDVISRIVYTRQEKDGLRKLQESIVRDINQLIAEMVRNCEAGSGMRDEGSGIKDQGSGIKDPSSLISHPSSLISHPSSLISHPSSLISYVVCAGNPTMTHLLLGLEVANIRREPYIPVVQYPPVIRAAEVGLHIHERGLLRALPGVASYVGGDIVAGILASGLHQSAELALYFDIGTNGEVVLGNKDWLICCSASAGPSFEGGEMKSGMRAAAGAIERVSLGPEGQVATQVIGGGKPRGICGSGLIDCVAELVRWGYVDRAGQFHPPRSHPAESDKETRRQGDKEHRSPSPPLLVSPSPCLPLSGVREGEFEWEFLLVPAEASDTGQDVVVTQCDLDVFLRSKGAVYTAAESLVSHLGLSFADVDRVYIAGGFGNYLDLRNAITIGLLPDLPLEKFHFLGNASLAGAKMVLMSREALEEAERIAAKMTYWELSTDPKFMNEFTSSLFLPHTNLEKFPSVRPYARGGND